VHCPNTIYFNTDSVQNDRSWGGKSYTKSLKIYRLILITFCIVYKHSKLVPNVSQINPVHAITPSLFRIISNTIIPSVPRSTSWSLCCTPRGPSGERIVDIVPGGRELELQLRRGVGQVARTLNNPHVKCAGVY